MGNPYNLRHNTGSASKSDIEKGLVVGADGYITKTFDGDELCATIERCIAQAVKATAYEN